MPEVEHQINLIHHIDSTLEEVLGLLNQSNNKDDNSDNSKQVKKSKYSPNPLERSKIHEEDKEHKD